MKNKFTIQIRGNVLFESEVALQTAIQETLKSFPGFNATFQSIETWVDVTGAPKKFNDDGTLYVEPVEVTTESEELEDVAN